MVISFFRHKNTQLSTIQYEYLRNNLERVIQSNEKCVFFLGGYGNFDTLCLNLLKKLKKSYPYIELVFITPYLREDYEKLKTARDIYDDIIYPPIETTPLRFAILKEMNGSFLLPT